MLRLTIVDCFAAPSLQRDYALLGNRPHHATLDPELVSEDAQGEGGDEEEVRAVSELQTDGGSSIAGDPDNMSNLSLPGAPIEELGAHASRGRGSSRPTSAHVTSPYMGPTSFGDRSRGNRAVNLHQQLPGSPVHGRRLSTATSENMGGLSQVGGIPSMYILGGQHMMPPADADMRSQTELDYADHTSVDTFLPHAEGDVLPRPGGPRLSQSSLHHQYAVNEPVQPSETSPLLSGIGSSSAYGVHHAGGHSAAGRQRKPSWQTAGGWDIRQPAPPDQSQLAEIAQEPEAHLHRREISVLLSFSLPIWLTHLLELSLNVVSVFSLGHLGTNELAAASLSSMTANVTGFSILAGFISALDSILPGAYTSQPKMVGLYTQRMLVVVCYLLVPICAIWLASEYILLRLGQEPIVASLAALYLRTLVIGLPGYAGFEVCRRYLQAQGLMQAPTLVLFIVSPINALLNWLFVWGPENVRFGFVGAPMASVISMWLMFILGAMQCYIAPRIAWDGWSTRAFTGLKPILQLGTAGTFAMCAEWWSWEIVGLVTSKLGTITLAAQSVLLVCSSISYQMPYAISVAAAVRVGNLLGASQAKHANISSNMSMLLSLCAGAVNSTIFMVIRNQLGTFFSNDPEVIALVTAVVPVMAAFQIMDGVCGVAAGILRGTGRQSAGAIINLTGYYAVGIPIGLFLTFGPPRMGLSGLWIGLTIALTYAAVFSALIIKRTDWEGEVRKTLMMMGQDDNAAKSANGDRATAEESGTVA